jgi:hypothetical protein
MKLWKTALRYHASFFIIFPEIFYLPRFSSRMALFSTIGSIRSLCRRFTKCISRKDIVPTKSAAQYLICVSFKIAVATVSLLFLALNSYFLLFHSRVCSDVPVFLKGSSMRRRPHCFMTKRVLPSMHSEVSCPWAHPKTPNFWPFLPPNDANARLLRLLFLSLPPLSPIAIILANSLS